MKAHTIHLSAVASTGTVDVPVVVPFRGIITGVIFTGTFVPTVATTDYYVIWCELTRGSINPNRGANAGFVDGPLIALMTKYYAIVVANQNQWCDYTQYFGPLNFLIERGESLNLRLIGDANMNTCSCECLIHFSS